MLKRIYTIGHSTRTLEEFLALLAEHEVQRLADIRRYPGSRRYPHFSGDSLRQSLPANGILYEHFDALGGRRQPAKDSQNAAWENDQFRGYADHMATPEFQRAVDRLLDHELPTAVMCVEAVPWRCHRNLLSDELLRRGIEEVHIVGAGSAQPHALSKMAHRGGTGHLSAGPAIDVLSRAYNRSLSRKSIRMSMAAAESPATAERDVVLAVDDNEHNLQLLEEYLWSWGYDVVLAHDGREAVDLYPRCNPSIIVLDVMMPNMDGYEACQLIKASPAGRTIPILMLTALTGSEDKIRALEAGADDFLNKPINREELRTRIRSLIKIRNLRKELDSSENIIMTLTSALESKDARTIGHVHRVAAYSAHLCDKLGLSAEEKETVIKGAMLHDLGMIGVPDHLLTALPRDDEERGRVADHTRMGASILEPMMTFRQFVPIVRWHHERWDGRGYPDRLKGDEIPLEAQIVGIANRFDEIHHERVMTETDAMQQLLQETAEGAFDPVLVKFFSSALDEESPKAATSKHMRPRLRPKSRVLCIDDNRMSRDLVAATLAGTDMDLLIAEDVRQALGIMERDAVDVVLLDLQDGAASLKVLRADTRWEFVPVVVLTSHRNSGLRQEAIVAGADDFINYPMNRLELVTRIHSLLRIKDFHADLEQTQNVICALALALEAKDHYTRGHSQRVGDLARTFALHVGLSASQAELIRTAGLLHDIGKIAVPERLLNKQGPLTRDEFLSVIDHPVIGEEMVRPLTTLSAVLQMIRHHHERYDGRGYPDGLCGDAIPYEVRLLSIIDAYDALTSHRSYRPAPLSHDAAIATLRRESNGGKWDPKMVEQFAAMLGTSAPSWDAISQPAPVLRLA